MPEDSIDHIDFDVLNEKALSAPLVNHIYTADPSAHYFNGKIYIYPSHDIDAGEAFDDLGSHFAMEDYHVISMDNITSKAIDMVLPCTLTMFPGLSVKCGLLMLMKKMENFIFFSLPKIMMVFLELGLLSAILQLVLLRQSQMQLKVVFQ